MQPYQRATEETNRQQALPGQALNAAASAIGTVAAGGALYGKVAPFLSRFIPQALAIQGLSKANPTLGKFAQASLNQGEPWEEVKEFIKDKFEGNEKPPEETNIIQKYSPALHDYIADLIKRGSAPMQAAAKAKQFLDKSKQDLIKKMEQDYKTDWGSIVESIFGKGDMAPVQGQQQQAQPQQMQQGQQQGQGLDPAVAQIIQQGNAILQNFKGGM